MAFCYPGKCVSLFALSLVLRSTGVAARNRQAENHNYQRQSPRLASLNRRRRDFLYADIWPGLAEPGTVTQIRQTQTNLQASTIYFWGQELAIYEEIKKFGTNNEPPTDDELKRVVNEIIQLPLLIPAGVNYFAMI